MATDLQIKQILTILARYECFEGIFWDEECNFRVICNDTFCYASADAEAIETDADIELLRQCFKDVEKVEKEHGIFSGYEALILYCARRANIQPLKELMAKFKPEFRALFEVIGNDN